MDPHQLAIARLAWARTLGLPDDALTTSGVRVARDSDTVSFLRLGDVCTLVGPASSVDRSRGRPLTDFTDPSSLLSLVDDRSARYTGPMALLFASDYADSAPGPDEDERPLVSDDPAHAQAVAARCPPDDAAEAALAQWQSQRTLLTDDEVPTASAGYRELEGLLADFGALTSPEYRRLGHASVIGRITTDDALDSGLVPQCRVHRDNFAAHRLARTLGYVEAGLYASVNVQPHE